MNTKVYIVRGIKDYYSDIVKVFDTMYKADMYVDSRMASSRNKYDFYEIEVFDVS